MAPLSSSRPFWNWGLGVGEAGKPDQFPFHTVPGHLWRASHPYPLDSIPCPGLVVITDFSPSRPPRQERNTLPLPRHTPRPLGCHNHLLGALFPGNEETRVGPEQVMEGSLRFPERPELCRPGQPLVYTAVVSRGSPHTPSAPGVSSQRTLECWGRGKKGTATVPPPS